MNWITSTEAVALTGKAEPTIRRWISKNKKDQNAVKKENGRTLINRDKILETYRISIDIHSNKSKAEEARHHKEAVQVATSAKSIDSITLQLQAKDEQIKQLIARKSYLPLWLALIFFMLSSAILSALYFGFIKYKAELIENNLKRQELQAQHFQEKLTAVNEQLKTKSSQINNQNTFISQQAKTIAQQRAELAEKDRLISQLYNDTKAQNKTLLELTESLKKEVIKSEQKENALP